MRSNSYTFKFRRSISSTQESTQDRSHKDAIPKAKMLQERVIIGLKQKDYEWFKTVERNISMNKGTPPKSFFSLVKC